MIGEMRKAEVVGPLPSLPGFLEAIQFKGFLHVVEIPLYDGVKEPALHRLRLTDEQAREKGVISELIGLLAETIDFVPESFRNAAIGSEAYLSHYEQWKNADIGAIGVSARSTHASARSLARRMKNLGDDIGAIAAYEEAAEALAPLAADPGLPEEYEFTGLILEAKSAVVRNLLKKELEKLTDGEFLYLEAPLSGKRIAALVGFSRRHSRPVFDLLLDKGVGKMSIPRYLRDAPFREAIARMREDIVALRKKRDSLEEQAKAFRSRKCAELTALLDVCRDRGARYDVLDSIAVTKHSFIVRGWVPARDFDELKRIAEEATGGAAVVRVLRPGKEDSPPVKLDNPRAVKPFEPLLGFFPLPRYGTVDPTVYLATVFPPVFGLMLADIGYGLLFGLGALAAARFSRPGSLGRKLAFVAAACAFFSILFGVVFGEFFGELGKQFFGLHPLWQERFSFTGPDRVKTLVGYMAITLTVGVFHVLLALILSIINSRRTGDRGAVVDSMAKIAGVFVLLFAVGRLTSLLPPIFTTAGVAALVAFAALMLYQTLHKPAHGLLLPLEVLGTVGNILSYVRIMAVGLVSVVLAFLANLFGEMIGNIVLAVIVSLLVHALNLALGIIDPTIQGLRLHYVEFSSKFFLGGGTPYDPLRKIGGRS